MSNALSLPMQRGFALIVALALALSAMVPLVAPAATRAVSTTLTISEVYGGGGNSGATLTHDFIELRNLTDAPIDLTGMSLQYASATGTGNLGASATQLTELSGSIPAHGYVLVQQAQGSGGTSPLPTADLIDPSPIAMSGSAGKVALATGTDSLGCNGGSTPCNPNQLARIVDFVGWGSADFFEGSAAAPATTNPASVQRLDGGCQDTDDNASDFALANPPTPQNSTSPATACEPDQPTAPTGTGSASPNAVFPGGTTTLTVVVSPGTNPESSDITVTADLALIGGDDAQPFTSADGLTFTFEASVADGTPPGLVSLPVTIADAEGRTGSTTIGLTVRSVSGGNVVISQVYGGGGNSGATLTHDFIELFNRTAESVSLAGWSVQYASAAGSSWQVTPLTGSIAPGAYYLIQQAQGAGGSVGLPPPDASGTIAMAAGAGKVALLSGTAPLTGTCPTVGSYVDLVGYGSTASCFEGSGPTGNLSNTTAALRLEDGARDTNDNAADFEVATPDPRNSGTVEPPPPTGDCGDEATFIHTIQGLGLTSPLDGQTVTIQGVVVGDFQNNAAPDDGQLGGYFVQEEDTDTDGDPTTSEGILVFGSNPDVAVGNLVRITGTVDEFGDGGPVTELTGVSEVLVCAENVDLPSAATVTLPVESIDDFERYEGMLVTFEQTLTISEFFNYDRFGEVVLTVDRDFQPTAVFEPDSPEADALAVENRLNRITLDDGLSSQNPSFTRHPNGEEFTLENRFRGGDTLANVTGVMDHSFGLYRVQPTDGADYTAVNERPAAPDDVGGSLTVASFNVLNYFTTLDLGPDVCGPAEDQDCRGADNAEELARQQAKIVAALAEMDADVVGLIEIENHPGDVPTATLVEALNAEVGAGTYDFVETGAIGTDAIRVAVIYKPATVTPVGDFAILDSTVDPRFDDDRNRPVLAQAFEENATGGIVTVAVNHLKSKGSDCGGPPDDDPVQGNCNGTRTMAAEAMVDWLATDPTGSGDLDALIIGDLNAYDKEDPIDAIRDGGYTDLVHDFEGEFAYSYVFDGQLGYLDTGLASPTLAPQVTGATVWHINADEPDLLDYDTSFKSDAQDALYEPDAYRSSDHDPVIVGLDLLAFGFGGLEPPIDETNAARAGRTVPVKFALGGDLGLDVLFSTPQVFDCGGWPAGASEDAVSTDGAGLRYDPVADQYVFNWKTDGSWAGECKMLVVFLADGTYATADFEFR